MAGNLSCFMCTISLGSQSTPGFAKNAVNFYSSLTLKTIAKKLQIFPNLISENQQFCTKIESINSSGLNCSSVLCEQCQEQAKQLAKLCKELDKIQQRIGDCLEEFSKRMEENSRPPPEEAPVKKETQPEVVELDCETSSEEETETEKDPVTSESDSGSGNLGLTRYRGLPTVFLCRHCPQKFNHLSKMSEHTKTAHPKEYQQQTVIISTCTQCHKTFVTAGDLEKHMQNFCTGNHSSHPKSTTSVVPAGLQEPEPPVVQRKNMVAAVFSEFAAESAGAMFHCEVCQVPYENPRTLTVHMKQRHPIEYLAKEQQLLTCQLCGEKFASRFSARNHEKSHGDDEWTAKRKREGVPADPLA